MKLPDFEINENLPVTPALTLDAVPVINRASAVSLVIEAFLDCRIPNKKTARTYRRNITEAFEMMCVAQLSELQMVQLVAWKGILMADRRGESSHAAALIAVRSFLDWTGAMGGHDLPMERVKYLLPVPKVQVIRPHEVMNEKEIKSYLFAAKCEGKRELALAIVALGSGVRIAELVALDICDFLNDAGGGTTIHVRQGKGAKDRLIPVRKEVKKAVEDYLKASFRSRGDVGPLFMSEDRAMACRESWRLSTKTASKIIKSLAEKAGVTRRITPHALRHTFAAGTYLHSRNLVAVMKLLGHSTIATTQRYVNHLDDLDLRTATPAFLVGGRGPRVHSSIKHPQAA